MVTHPAIAAAIAAAAAMSPLARSLLALAALLSTADAKVYNMPQQLGGKCNGFKMDIESKQFGDYIKSISFEFQVDGHKQLHTIIDRCAVIGGVISSQTVKVCNEFNHPKVPHWSPPKVSALGSEVLSPVMAACDPQAEAAHECGPLTVYVTQVCCRPYPHVGR